MRCKPGDLAILIRGYPENIGLCVEVVGPGPPSVADWLIRSDWPITTGLGPINEALCMDSSLLPIRPQHDEAEETERVTEAIHHADGDANNNAIDNLRIDDKPASANDIIRLAIPSNPSRTLASDPLGSGFHGRTITILGGHPCAGGVVRYLE